MSIRLETPPSEVAQSDFGYVGLVRDSETTAEPNAWVFIMVTGFSRHRYAHLVFDQAVRARIDCQFRAFERFGRAPRNLVPDDLNAAVVKAAFGIAEDPTI